MTFYAIGEPDYTASSWYRAILEGLLAEKRRKRFALTLLERPEEVSALVPTDADVIFVIGTDTEWVSHAISACEARFGNRVILLGNHKPTYGGKSYSTVTADVAGNVRLLYAYLRAHGKRRVAMYGINPASTSDAFRQESFLACGGRAEDLFYNKSALARCFADFSPRCADYDGVICVNDYAAISLLRHLQGHTAPFIVSCGGTALAVRTSPTVTHTRIPFGAFGKAGVELARMLCAGEAVSAVHIHLAGEFVPGESTACLPMPRAATAAVPVIGKAEDRFYADPEVGDMMKLEQLLAACDDEDLMLLSRLLKRQTYADMASELFLSENTVKYKLKSMFRLCGVSSRAECIRFIEKYL